MTDVFTKEKRSWVMSRIKSTETKIEKRLETVLKKNNVRFKKYPQIFGKPDFLVNNKIVIFVDGCFWHKCPKHYNKPKTRGKFWISKIQSNVKRDKKVLHKLRKEGYTVLRFWEHDIEKRPNYLIDKLLIRLSNTI